MGWLKADVGKDPVFGLQEEYLKDKRKNKVNLSIGVCTGPTSLLKTFKAVRLAESLLFREEKEKGYLPVEGDLGYLEESAKLIFERDVGTVGIQTVGGTSALYCGMQLAKTLNMPFLVSDPTWSNHLGILNEVSIPYERYPYGDDVDIVSFFKSQKNKIVLLQSVGHNPTGIDLSKQEWIDLSKIFLENNLIPFFDNAYQGFAEGIDLDRYPVNLFKEEGHRLFVAHSYSKSMGLYGERVGALFVTGGIKEKNYLLRVARRSYSNPPKHGALIVKTILSDKMLYSLWTEELNMLRERTDGFRKIFVEKLGNKFKGYGFFVLLPKEYVGKFLENAIYLSKMGRMNLSSMNNQIMERVLNLLS